METGLAFDSMRQPNTPYIRWHITLRSNRNSMRGMSRTRWRIRWLSRLSPILRKGCVAG